MASTKALRDLLSILPRTDGLITTVMDTAFIGLGLSWTRYRILRLVADAPLPVPQVARMLGLTRQAVQRLVNDLLTTGTLTRRPNPNHQRANLIALSEKGRDLFAEARRRENAVLGWISKRVESNQVTAASKVLGDLHAGISDIDAEDLIEGQLPSEQSRLPRSTV